MPWYSPLYCISCRDFQTPMCSFSISCYDIRVSHPTWKHFIALLPLLSTLSFSFVHFCCHDCHYYCCWYLLLPCSNLCMCIPLTSIQWRFKNSQIGKGKVVLWEWEVLRRVKETVTCGKFGIRRSGKASWKKWSLSWDSLSSLEQMMFH